MRRRSAAQSPSNARESMSSSTCELSHGNMRALSGAGSSMASVNDFNRNVIDEFRSNNGKVGGQFGDAPLVLLTTTGAKSGKPHTTPVVYTRDGDNLVDIACVRFRGGQPESVAILSDAIGALAAFPSADTKNGLSIDVGKAKGEAA